MLQVTSSGMAQVDFSRNLGLTLTGMSSLILISNIWEYISHYCLRSQTPWEFGKQGKFLQGQDSDVIPRIAQLLGLIRWFVF